MTRTRKRALISLAATAAVAAAAFVFAQSAPSSPKLDPLAQGFVTPPDSAKPRTWWHWTNGNVTETGITKDLEWMQRVGIGGFQLVDVASGNGQVVEPKINFGTPEWYHAVLHSAQLAKQLDLEMSIFSCAGWSEAGGPWVSQQMAMKRLVWSETDVISPGTSTIKLPEPPSNEGNVRDSTAGGSPNDPPFYADSAVVAYRSPPDEVPMASLHPKVTTSSGPIDGAALMDNSLNTACYGFCRCRRWACVAAVRVRAAVYRACALARQPPLNSHRPHPGQRRWSHLPHHRRHAGSAGLPRCFDKDVRVSGGDGEVLPH
jgi:hypothetical protein